MDSVKKRIADEKHRTIFQGPSSDTLVLQFKDDYSIEDNIYTIHGKGALHNSFSETIHKAVQDMGMITPFIKRTNMREQLVYAIDPLPFYLQLYTIAPFEMSERYGLDENLCFSEPLVEWVHKHDTLGDRLISEEHVLSFGWLAKENVDDLKRVAIRVCDFLMGYFMAQGLRLLRLHVYCACGYDPTLGHFYMIMNDWSFDQFAFCNMKTSELIDVFGLSDPKEIEDAYAKLSEFFSKKKK
jgi:phosphoribosylaminoimidazole-succinocarboxamide synthase